MKIIVLQDHLRSGGTERQSVLLANAFAAAGHAVRLVTFRPGGPLVSTVSSVVALRSLQSRDRGLDWFAPGLATLARNEPADIILCMGRMANCYGEYLVRHAASAQVRTAVVGTMRTGKNLPWLFRRSLRRARHIVANSQAAQRNLVRLYGLPAVGITVIPNSLVFPDTLAYANNQALRRQYGADDDTRVLLDVAMFRPEKNQRELIAIAAGLPAGFRWQLWLAGDGPEHERCARYAAEIGVGDRVKFPGLVRDPNPLYATADVAVHASRKESLSNFLIEAQAHGLPAVAYAAQGIDECFVPGDTGVALPFGNQAAFRAAIQRFADRDPARRERARAFARRTFDPARQVQAYLELFRQLAELPS
ncbi:MAG: glycosyltransferase [Opitutales bacterium]